MISSSQIHHLYCTCAALFAVDDSDFAEELAGVNDVEDDFLAGRRQRDDFDAAL